MHMSDSSSGFRAIEANHELLGSRWFYCEDKPELLFTDNETNNQRLFHTPNPSPFVKDGINSCVVEGNPNAVNPKHTGTKAAARYILKVRPRSEAVIRLRLTDMAPGSANKPFGREFDSIFNTRKKEADEFYAEALPQKRLPTKR